MPTDQDPAKSAEDARLDDRNWHWGIFYACAEDPRTIVRNRWLFGWTWNFGHPHVFPTMALFVSIAVVPTLVALALGARRLGIAAVVVASTVIVVLLAHRIASGE